MNRTLDYVPRLDERNRAYRIQVGANARERDRIGMLTEFSRYWTPGYPVLDQGAEGACVGFGCTGEYMASPVRGKAPGPTTAKYPGDVWGQMLAMAVYLDAKRIDEWEGEAYDGTSVRAGMLVGRERGWWSGFSWAFNMLELRAALEEGPVVIGIQVLERMWDTEPNGDWIPDGPEVGWHCVYLYGYSPNYYGRGPRYLGGNSWSLEWGRRGRFAIEPSNLDRILFQAGGEAAVPQNRAL